MVIGPCKKPDKKPVIRYVHVFFKVEDIFVFRGSEESIVW